jgi:hypothetical protein
MNPETEEFLTEGMGRYKEAAFVMVSFGKEIELRLKAILENRREWGKFKLEGGVRAKSTTYWSEYPLLNAKIRGELEGEKVQLSISVNWYDSQTEYPYYVIGIEPAGHYLLKADQSDWGEEFDLKGNWLRFCPDPEDFDLNRDFNKLLDKFIEILEEST